MPCYMSRPRIRETSVGDDFKVKFSRAGPEEHAGVLENVRKKLVRKQCLGQELHTSMPGGREIRSNGV